MGKQRWLLALISFVVIGAIAVLMFIPARLGLDLQGGAQLTIQVKPTAEIQKISPQDLEAVQRVLDNRINALGVSEPLIQTAGNDKIIVQLPGVSDPQQAERVLGGTADLEFREQKPGTEAQFRAEREVQSALLQKLEELKKTGDTPALSTTQGSLTRSHEAIASLFKSTGLTGKFLDPSGIGAQPTQNGNNWEVAIRFKSEGGDKFAELTKNLAGTGRAIGIFLDNQLISAPEVSVDFAQTGITGGGAVITGRFTVQEAKELEIQLRGGALPLPVEIVENRTVGATLGRDSIQKSIYAGLGGLSFVLIFMGVYYRVPGFIADLALIIYAVLTLATFNLLGVVLTLPGIAGFILSIGMAVDANVLIFERTREELRAGKTLYRSVESGFYRAFSSILDSNVTTLISCAALFWLGTGLVKGFALTLALGVLTSMFTAVTCSRTFMLAALNVPGLRKPHYFCPNLTTASKVTFSQR